MLHAIATAALTIDAITDWYVASGGTAPPQAIRRYLDGLADLPPEESDLLADTVNELSQKTSALPVPYLAEDIADDSPERSRRSLGAAGAFLLSDSEREKARIDAVARTKLLDTVPEERFDRITRTAQRHFQVSTAIVTLIDHERQFLKSVVGPVEQNMPRARSFCNTTIRAPHSRIVRDTFLDDSLRWNPLVLGEPFIRFYAGHPLRSPDGWIVGTLCVIDQHTRTFSEADERSLRLLSEITENELAA